MLLKHLDYHKERRIKEETIRGSFDEIASYHYSYTPNEDQFNFDYHVHTNLPLRFPEITICTS